MQNRQMLGLAHIFEKCKLRLVSSLHWTILGGWKSIFSFGKIGWQFLKNRSNVIAPNPISILSLG